MLLLGSISVTENAEAVPANAATAASTSNPLIIVPFTILLSQKSRLYYHQYKPCSPRSQEIW